MLFGNKKDSHENNDNQNVKQAASQNSSSPDTSSFEQPQQQKDFVNPFAQDKQQPQQQPSPSFNSEPPQSSPNTQQNPFPQQPQPQQDPFANAAMQSSPQQQTSFDEEKLQEMIDETVEKVIEEAWGELTTRVDKVVKWKDNVEQQINLLKEDIVTVRDGFESLEKKLMNKLSNYDRNILDVNSEMKALEKVFNKITPTLVNNVNELSKIADDLRGEKKKKENVKDD